MASNQWSPYGCISSQLKSDEKLSSIDVTYVIKTILYWNLYSLTTSIIKSRQNITLLKSEKISAKPKFMLFKYLLQQTNTFLHFMSYILCISWTKKTKKQKPKNKNK